MQWLTAWCLRNNLNVAYVRCHHGCHQARQLDRQQRWWQGCVCATGSLGAALVWMVGIRDIHTKRPVWENKGAKLSEETIVSYQNIKSAFVLLSPCEPHWHLWMLDDVSEQTHHPTLPKEQTVANPERKTFILYKTESSNFICDQTFT